MRLLLLLFVTTSLTLAQFGQQQYQSTVGFVPMNGQQLSSNNANSNPNSVSNSNSDSYNHYQPSYVTGSTPIVNGGTSLQFAIRSYSDPGSRTPDGGMCRCPEGVDCEDQCRFTFTFIVATPNVRSEVFETSEITLDVNGDLPHSRISDWGTNYQSNIQGRPTSLDILVHHRGLTFDQMGKPQSANKLIMVDRFNINLESILPSVGGVQSMSQSNDYIGNLISTRISLSMSISCTGTLIGPDCDLACIRSTINQNVASCRSNSTGYFAICNYNSMNQVENCRRCPWGVKDDTYCQDEEGGVLNPATAGVVDTSYKTATIILSIILVILLVIIALVVVILCLKSRKRDKRSEPLPGYNVRSSEGAVQRPLLQPRNSQDGQNNIPTPLPRSVPPEYNNTNTPKSALKKVPVLPPPAHFGGSNSINDSVNTSYSDVPMRPSRSEVV